MTDVSVEPLTGPDLVAALPELARLRITVFREWPYLYDGSAAYEEEYLGGLAKADDAVIVAARDGPTIVGMATASPLAAHTVAFVPLFQSQGFDPVTIFYCGESVLLPAYRGRGIGHLFFDLREAHAGKLNAAGAGYTHSAFCGVVRADDDPRRAEGYVPLDGFWRKRGYAPVDGLVGSYDWREIGQADETRKAMQFWVKAL
jgi:GNAT superfamily N-acetyltransferase